MARVTGARPERGRLSFLKAVNGIVPVALWAATPSESKSVCTAAATAGVAARLMCSPLDEPLPLVFWFCER